MRSRSDREDRREECTVKRKETALRAVREEQGRAARPFCPGHRRLPHRGQATVPL